MSEEATLTRPSAVAYLWEQILNHIKLFFPSGTEDLVKQTEVLFVPYSDTLDVRRPAVVIPIDITAPLVPCQPYSVEFNGTRLTLWNRLPFPDGKGWSCLPNSETPLWYRHLAGTLVPAYNFFGNVMNLLTLRAERENPARDCHGRFPTEADPRHASGLLQVPAFNESVAALVDACAGISAGTPPRFHLKDFAPSVVLVLSHDCDILLGNDLITQSIRLLRVLLPLLRVKPPKFANIWWTLRNIVHPRDFYLYDIPGMVEFEREVGFRSAFYMLNGSKGRFGARSGPQAILEAVEYIPEGWDIGMHYNYDTCLDAERFVAQKSALEKLLGRAITSGRAHYLRFDPCDSWRFWAEHGIRCDESLGYPDFVGYRCGIAGIFKPLDPLTGRKLDIWEVPITVMDSALVGQYGEDPIGGCKKLLAHLASVGGALSILFHPGVLANPEFPELLGLYSGILKAASTYTSQGIPAVSLVERLVLRSRNKSAISFQSRSLQKRL